MISAVSAMLPPSEPNLSMAALRAQERSLAGSGANLAVPEVQVAPPVQIVGMQPHIGLQLDAKV